MEKEPNVKMAVPRVYRWPSDSGKSSKMTPDGKLARGPYKRLPSRTSTACGNALSPSGLTPAMSDDVNDIIFKEIPSIFARRSTIPSRKLSRNQLRRMSRSHRGRVLALQHPNLVTESAASKSEEASSTPNEGDEYKWYKYGSNRSPGNRGSSCYYKCLADGCGARKVVITSIKGHSSTEEVMYVGSHSCMTLPQKRQRDGSMDVQPGVEQETMSRRSAGRGGKCKEPFVQAPQPSWVKKLQTSMSLRRKVDPVAAQMSGASDMDSEEISERSVEDPCWDRSGEEESSLEHGTEIMGTPMEDPHLLTGGTQDWGCSQVAVGSQSWDFPGPSQDWGQSQDFTLDQGYVNTKQSLDEISLMKTVLDSSTCTSDKPDDGSTCKRHVGVPLFEFQNETLSSPSNSVNNSPIALDENCNILEPISSLDLSRLRKLQTGREILVAGRAVVLNSAKLDDFLEFVFLDGESMSCILGVGLDYSKVRMTSGFNIELIGCEENEWGLLWAEALDEHCTFQILAVMVPEAQDEQSLALTPFKMAEMYGVGVNQPEITCAVKCANWDDQQQLEVAEEEPLLWAVAKHLLTAQDGSVSGRQHTDGASGGGKQGQGNFSNGNTLSSTLNIPDFFALRIGSSGGANGDGDEKDSTGATRTDNGLVSAMDRALSLRVTIRPGRGGIVNSTEFGVPPPKSLAKVSKIFPTLTFDFEKRRDYKSISVEILAECPLGEGGPNAREKDRFGWYHDHINVSLKCQVEDTSVLEDYGILHKGETVRGYMATSSTNANSNQLQNQTNLSASIQVLGGISIGTQGSVNRTTNISGTNYEGYELGSQQLHEGFGFCDKSSMGEARLAYEFFFQTEVPRDVWCQSTVRRWYAQSGLCSTLKPQIKGTWSPQDEDEHSSYLFEISRELVERFKISNGLLEDSGCREYTQVYVVPLFVNHAMTHLEQVGKRNCLVNEKVREIPKVILLGQGII